MIFQNIYKNRSTILSRFGPPLLWRGAGGEVFSIQLCPLPPSEAPKKPMQSMWFKKKAPHRAPQFP